ncbi:quinohemoprotein alcohol dehydrogenase [Haloarcula sp. CBA1130]|uniref:PQQ-binding-like beta-propeller repeat protein n=1 Tax=unclassified Haloarcula TaxID=2624677 RepID=UPI0012471C9B|nr:quinohemoprotein alcohol dehydrogenase [Haloarcula sp. CBA1129]KAA9400518.1 quinohemoprotein alcohol dehydrogenase [Haloarcula sp. CBA1130]
MVATGSVASIAGCSSSCPDDGAPDPSHTVEPSIDTAGFETVPGGSWPSPRFDAANTGYASVQLATTTPSVRWQADISTAATGDETTSAAVVADETVVLTTSTSVVALSLSDGTEQWRHELTPATVPSIVGIGDGPAPPVLADGRVFLSTEEGVIALEIGDGTVAWRNTDTAGAGVPTVTDAALFVPMTDGVARFDVDDGRRQWTATVDGPRLAVADGTVVVAGEQIVAVDEATGERQWEHSDRPDGYPVVSDGTVYVSGTYGDLIGRDLTDGTEQWRLDDRRSLEVPVVTPDSVYAIERPGESASATFAFDRVDDGPPAPRWCSEINISGAVTAAADDAVFTFQRDDGLTAFTTRFGEAVWQYPAEYEAVSLAVLDGGIVSASPDGTVVALGGA